LNSKNKPSGCGEGVVEFFHGDLSVTIRIESSEKGVFLMFGHEDIETF
jgi:hypothetical protein|tara:strand:+ start:88 stop:231 length:144 start_codon:yes stop_codon:yes gene_type:complete